MRVLARPSPFLSLLGWLLLAIALPANAQSEAATLVVSQGTESRRLALEEIERTGLHHVEMHHPEGPEGRFSGVWLDAFLADQGLDEARRVRFIAHDDYTTFLTPAQRDAKAYLLVTRLDGAPLARDYLGPFMLVVPADVEAVRRGSEPMSRWIWAIREVSAL